MAPKKPLFLVCALLFLLPLAKGWQSDLGDGTYRNPPLNADYPDPDIIRVGEDFYFASTTFANSPGLNLLHSKDLVNWELVGHVMPKLEGRPQFDLREGNAYRGGVYAPSLRYHKGIFYIVVTPVHQNTRIYYSRDIRGPWQFHELDRAAFDPGLFIEEDGRAYIATSGGWDGTITLLSLDEGLTRVVSEQKIHYIKGAEGSKIVKRGSWYYLFNAIPRRLGLTVSRAKNITGPWETIPSIDDKTGGHQGAMVDLPDGSWYGFIMCDSGAIGRVTNISPLRWENDWPIWGEEKAPGRVPASAVKPIQGKPLAQPGTSDEFSGSALSLQWQWNHNPVDARWSLSERPGFLRLKSVSAPRLWEARNTLTQKGQAPWCRGDVRLELAGLKPGDRCGFGSFGKICGDIVVSCLAPGKFELALEVYNDGVGQQQLGKSLALAGSELFLRTEMDFAVGKACCFFSTDGKVWTQVGEPFPLMYDWRTGTFQGQQFALFCYNPAGKGGHADIDWFRFADKP